MMKSQLLYVKTIWFSQYCSCACRQLAQVPHEPTMQPTPARSPTLNFFTSLPTPATRPTISWPGTIGKMDPPHSSRTERRTAGSVYENRNLESTRRGGLG